MTINIFGCCIEVKKSILVVIIISIAVITGSIGVLISRSNTDIIIDSSKTGDTEASGAKNDSVKNGDTNSMAEAGINLNNTDGNTANSGSSGNNGNSSSSGNIGNSETSGKDEIKIYIVGCVNKPGVITLKKGQLIDDAVKAAGGLTADADPASINMVYILNENVMLHILSKKEAEKNMDQQNNAAGNGVKVVKDSGSSVIVKGQSEAEASGVAAPKIALININTATEAELDTLPGIGAATAKEIIAYREKNGPFKNIKDIMKIPGIKESRFNAIKDYITVS